MYKDVQKNVFVDRHERFNVVEDCSNIVKKMEELKPCMVKFNKDSTMKPKTYPPYCTVKGENKQSIIVITYNVYTFSVNDGI